MQTKKNSEEFNHHDLVNSRLREDCVISFQARLPIPIQEAMNDFIERYPNWDQYRLIQAALAGFLVQNGVDSRSINRLYVGNMFRSNSLINNK